ncbi:hypothetical protein X975_09578, partial [Stegodyphus mimosarum]
MYGKLCNGEYEYAIPPDLRDWSMCIPANDATPAPTDMDYNIRFDLPLITTLRN